MGVQDPGLRGLLWLTGPLLLVPDVRRGRKAPRTPRWHSEAHPSFSLRFSGKSFCLFVFCGPLCVEKQRHGNFSGITIREAFPHYEGMTLRLAGSLPLIGSLLCARGAGWAGLGRILAQVVGFMQCNFVSGSPVAWWVWSQGDPGFGSKCIAYSLPSLYLWEPSLYHR